MKKNGLLFENRFFSGFGDAEFDDALGRNGDDLAFFGSELHGHLARGNIPQHEFADAGQRESVLGVLVSQLSDLIENLRRLLFADLGFLSDAGGDL